MKRYDAYKSTGIPWIPEVPEHWEVRRIGLFFSENKTANSNMQCTEAYKFNYGTLVRKDEGVDPSELVETYSKYTVLKPKDIVINGLNLNYDFITLRVAQAASTGIITSAYVVLSPRAQVYDPYFCYLFRAMDSIKLFHGMGSGIRLTLSYKDLKYQPLPLPPLSEQRAIVAYIERKERQIDAYIARQAEQIERLKELQQTIISHAVTRGIHPYTRFRPTGIPWIPEVPEHWEEHRCKNVLIETTVEVGDNATDYTLLSLTKNGVIIRDLSEGKGKFPKDYKTYKVVKPGDLVFCLFDVDETPRTVGYVRNHGMLTGAYSVFETRDVNTKYLCHYFISLDDRKALRPLYRGLRKVIPLPAFMSMPLFLPPLSEQHAIVAYIEKKTAAVDRMINACREQTELMKAYKQRLISDAVTGRIRVPEK